MIDKSLEDLHSKNKVKSSIKSRILYLRPYVKRLHSDYFVRIGSPELCTMNKVFRRYSIVMDLMFIVEV